jgi:hypothetical protein
MTAQLVLVGAMMLTRLLAMKKHLQCFLDTVVRVVSAHLMATQSGQTPDQSQLLPRVKVSVTRAFYLCEALDWGLTFSLFGTARNLGVHGLLDGCGDAVPRCAAVCVRMRSVAAQELPYRHRSDFSQFPFSSFATCTPLTRLSVAIPTGVCYTIYEAAKLPSGPLLSSITAAVQFNSSALALETASKPYFVTILRAAAGAQMTGANLSGTTPTEAIAAFALKFSSIYAFPAEVAVALCKALICMHSLMWFALNLAGLLAWRFKPSIIVG